MAKKQLSLEEIASEVGRLYGTTESHARRWLNQRDTLLEALGLVRDQADKLMRDIGNVRINRGDIPWPFGKRKRGRPVTNPTASPFTDTPRKRKGRRKISDATRAKMKAAAQKRWAAKKSR